VKLTQKLSFSSLTRRGATQFFAVSMTAACVAVALSTTPSLAQAQVKLDLAAAYAPANFHTENLVLFANDVDKATGGKVKITVHANASLFKAPEIKRAVQGNQAAIGEVLISNFENEWAMWGIDVIPFLADSYEESMKLYKITKPAMEKKLAEQGMMLLFAVPWPPQGIYSKKPLNSAADLKGMKWRAYNVGTAEIAKIVGAQAVTIQAAELSQALATGAVEAYISSGSTGYDTKTYEHVKYWYDTQAWLPKNAVIMNREAFSKLDKPSQDALLKASADAEAKGWKTSIEKNGWYLAELKKQGMNILPPPPQLKADMKKVGDQLLQQWLAKAGPEGKQAVDAFLKP
jgi:TRAP-type transport system periplasmic protein